MRVSVAVDLFLADRRSRGCGVCALAYYQQVCGLFSGWLLSVGVEQLASLDVLLLQRYVDYLRTRPQFGHRVGVLSSVTVRNHVRGLRTFFIWLRRSGFLQDDSLLLVSGPHLVRRLPKAVAPEVVRLLLLSSMTVRDRALLFLLVDSGLRIAEVAALQVSDVDLDRCMIHVRHGKGDKER